MQTIRNKLNHVKILLMKEFLMVFLNVTRSRTKELIPTHTCHMNIHTRHQFPHSFSSHINNNCSAWRSRSK